MNERTDQPAALAARLLEVMERDILPLTEASVARGNKIFGAAILRKSDRGLVLAETKNETENPLWHGEVHAIKRFHERPAAVRPAAGDCLFLATHEPCPLCLAAIAWAGFDNFFYLFGHADSRDAFAIPHDLRMLKEIFGLEPGGYRARNAYWTGTAIAAPIAAAPAAARPALQARADALGRRCAALSEVYQAGKAGNAIPLK